jgi:hypothetical protein
VSVIPAMGAIAKGEGSWTLPIRTLTSVA